MKANKGKGWVVTMRAGVITQYCTPGLEVVVAARRWRWQAVRVAAKRQAGVRIPTQFTARPVCTLPHVVIKES